MRPGLARHPLFLHLWVSAVFLAAANTHAFDSHRTGIPAIVVSYDIKEGDFVVDGKDCSEVSSISVFVHSREQTSRALFVADVHCGFRFPADGIEEFAMVELTTNKRRKVRFSFQKMNLASASNLDASPYYFENINDSEFFCASRDYVCSYGLMLRVGDEP